MSGLIEKSCVLGRKAGRAESSSKAGILGVFRREREGGGANPEKKLGCGSSLGLGEKEENSETFITFREGGEVPKKIWDFGGFLGIRAIAIDLFFRQRREKRSRKEGILCGLE